MMTCTCAVLRRSSCARILPSGKVLGPYVHLVKPRNRSPPERYPVPLSRRVSARTLHHKGRSLLPDRRRTLRKKPRELHEKRVFIRHLRLRNIFSGTYELIERVTQTCHVTIV